MIVVSGANRGLGNAICRRFSQRGERVIGLSRGPCDSDFEFMHCDVSDYESVKNAAKSIRRLKEPISAIVNAAGVASMNMAVTTDTTTVQRLIQTNLVGTIYCCQLFAPLLLRQKSGVIINFSTIAVAIALKGESVYAASKAGVEAFSRVFAKEVANFGVRVNCIAPGPIQTDLLRGITPEQLEKITSQQIFTRQFEKDDISDLVELLIDSRANSLTGQVFHVGGI